MKGRKKYRQRKGMLTMTLHDAQNLTMTLDEGRISTWRLPRRSALTMLFRQSF
jgi:hypothetical protein